MAVQKRWTYKITGTPSFPFDMLRYDVAYPDSAEDAAEMSSCADWYVNRQSRIFTLTLRGNRPPTVGRWLSFGWKVSEIREERI